MNVQTLLNEVDFKDVEKELLVTNPNHKHVLSSFSRYFEELRSVELSSGAEHSKIQVSREYFDYSYLTDAKTNDWINTFYTFVPAEQILSSEIANEDLEDLSKELIASLVLSLLTNEGTVFTEEERKNKVDSLQKDMEEVIA